ncbi:hypothetical protein [Roseivivax sp. THAF30]|nr:hypothetical protein [Roseivivax sp. THAF30]QFT61822.1 hypothetical protein FIU91_02680 [Roseivivax sp. THAF30]
MVAEWADSQRSEALDITAFTEAAARLYIARDGERCRGTGRIAPWRPV